MAGGRRRLPGAVCQRTGCMQVLPQGEAAITGPGPTEPPKRPLDRSGRSPARLAVAAQLDDPEDRPAHRRHRDQHRARAVSMPISVRAVELPQIGEPDAIPRTSARTQEAGERGSEPSGHGALLGLGCAAMDRAAPVPGRAAPSLGGCAPRPRGRRRGAGYRLGAGDLEHPHHVGVDAAGHVQGALPVVAGQLVVDVDQAAGVDHEVRSVEDAPLVRAPGRRRSSSASWLLAPPATIGQRRLGIVRSLSTAPRAQGASTSQSTPRISSGGDDLRRPARSRACAVRLGVDVGADDLGPFRLQVAARGDSRRCPAPGWRRSGRRGSVVPEVPAGPRPSCPGARRRR